jgi:putative inorganic carbon (HCO3(-)) transporter
MKKTLERVIELAFYLLFFLVPLILTPWNYELFEFNKMILTYSLAVIIISAWLIKMVLEKKFLFRRTFLDLPLLLFFFSQVISTIYSLDRHTSFWGYYSRFNGGLFSTTTYLLLYWAFVTNMNKEKALMVIRFLLYTTLLVSLYGIAEHFGIDAQYWVQDVQRRVFSTLGQPNWLAAWLVALLPLTWALAFTREKIFAKKQLFLLSFLFSGLFYLCLLYTKSRSGLFGLAIAYLAFWGWFLGKKQLKKKVILKKIVILNLLLFFLTVWVGTPWTPSLREVSPKIKPVTEATPSAEEEMPLLISESGEIREIVWQGAIDIWKNHPLLLSIPPPSPQRRL